MTIPEWDINKILPPTHPDTPAGFEHDLLYRAPYVASLEEFITRFVTTPERGNLMERFLAYRAALHQWDVTQGFQWINGSFVENLEQSSYPRPPRDIDVVTFYYGNDNHALYRNLMNPDLASQEFNVDAYGGRTRATTGYTNSHPHRAFPQPLVASQGRPPLEGIHTG